MILMGGPKDQKRPERPKSVQKHRESHQIRLSPLTPIGPGRDYWFFLNYTIPENRNLIRGYPADPRNSVDLWRAPSSLILAAGAVLEST